MRYVGFIIALVSAVLLAAVVGYTIGSLVSPDDSSIHYHLPLAA